MKTITSIALTAVAVAAVVVGRVKGFHMTEGEAFVALWHYWLAAVVCCVGAIALNQKAKKKR